MRDVPHHVLLQARPAPAPGGVERDAVRVPVTVLVPELRQLLLVVGREGAEEDLREVVRSEVCLREGSI